MNKIKYICFYDNSLNHSKGGKISPAATTKIEYIRKVLNNTGYAVSLISLCTAGLFQVRTGKLISIDEINSLRFFFSIGRGNKFRNAFDILLTNLFLFLYLIFNTKKDEIVIYYHSIGFSNAIRLAKHIRKFKILMEVEEVYQHITKPRSILKNTELNSFTCSDAYIFPTALLSNKINLNNKPELIIHGSYNTYDHNPACNFNSNIHIVYAGTFDIRKGVLTAINSASHLPPNYHLHILGFGTNEEIETVLSEIKNVRTSECAVVTYDGLLTGSSYDDFLNKCDIGLSPQNINNEYNDSSFPSKILSYMGHGLQVVSIKIPAIMESAVGNNVIFYESDNPSELAKAIQSVNIKTKIDSRTILKQLNSELVKIIPTFLQSILSIKKPIR